MVVSCQIYFPLVKYTLYLISSHSWYFMELSPSAVALTFNPWPSNIYQLLKWLCTIIPSSISQIHHSDHSGQLQVYALFWLMLELDMESCCSTAAPWGKAERTGWLSTGHPWKRGLAVKDTKSLWHRGGGADLLLWGLLGSLLGPVGASEPMPETQAWKEAFGNVKLLFLLWEA